MGGLNSSGSSKSLRQLLFPQGFDGRVMDLVLETWKEFSLHNQVRLETHITAVFRDALIEAYVKAGRKWFISLEDPITDPDFGTETGRNDLRFYPPDHSGQKIFFTLECKRLRVRTKSGFKHLADEYVSKGMQRFIDGTYSAGLPYCGMLGYVMDNCVDDSFQSIQQEIKKRAINLKMKKKKSICTPSSILPSHRYSLDTFHICSDGELTIRHLLVGVTR